MHGNARASILSILISISVTIALASSIGEALTKAKARSYQTMTATIVGSFVFHLVDQDAPIRVNSGSRPSEIRR